MKKKKDPKPFEVNVKDFSITTKSKSKKGGKGGTRKETSSGQAKGKGVKWVRESEDEDGEGCKEGKEGDDRVHYVKKVTAKTECVMTRSTSRSDPSPSRAQSGPTPGCFSPDASCDAMRHVTRP